MDPEALLELARKHLIPYASAYRPFVSREAPTVDLDFPTRSPNP